MHNLCRDVSKDIDKQYRSFPEVLQKYVEFARHSAATNNQFFLNMCCSIVAEMMARRNARSAFDVFVRAGDGNP
jgi:hypothetical protein